MEIKLAGHWAVLKGCEQVNYCSHLIQEKGPVARLEPRCSTQGAPGPNSAPSASKTHSALSVMGFREFILPILEPTIKKKYERIL